MTGRGPAILLLLASLTDCSSWNTGAPSEDEAEQTCKAILETFARAAERCGEDYLRTYEALLTEHAAGDCKSVRSIRDEQSLRTTCLPFIASQPCEQRAEGTTHPSCASQLQH